MSKRQKLTTVTGASTSPEPLSPVDKIMRFISNKRAQLLFIVAVTFAFYGNSIINDFAQDDVQFYSENQFVQKGIAGIYDIFTKESMYGYYSNVTPANGTCWRPLTLITFAIEKEYSGGDPHISHFINMLLLALTGVIMLLLLRKYIFKSSPIAAFMVALLFIIHPVHTEAVSHIKSRDELLSWLFLLLTLYCSLNFLTKRNYWQLLLSLVFYFLALLSKEYGVSFIAILPFTFYFFTTKKLRVIVLITLSFMVVLGIYALIRFSFVPVISNTSIDIVFRPYLYATPVQRLATELMLLGKYILLLFWPNPLISDYSYKQVPYVNFSDWQVWLSVIIQAALVLYALLTLKEKNIVSYGILFYFCSIFIVSNIVIDTDSVIGERFLYQPSFGFCIAIVVAANEVLQKIKFKTIAQNFSILFIPIVGVVLLSGFQTTRRNAEWQNDRVLLSADVKKAPNCFEIHEDLGRIFQYAGAYATTQQERSDNFTKALGEYDTAVTILPNYAITWLNMGYLYLITANDKEAIKAYLKCIDIDSTFSQGYNGLGSVYYYEKNYEQALIYFKKGSQLKSGDTRFYYNIGLCYDNMGQYETAILYYKKALSLNSKLNNIQQFILDDEAHLQNKKL